MGPVDNPSGIGQRWRSGTPNSAVIARQLLALDLGALVEHADYVLDTRHVVHGPAVEHL